SSCQAQKSWKPSNRDSGQTPSSSNQPSNEDKAQGERLQKVLARAGYGSRRACEELIEDRRVTVNGEVAELGRRVDTASERVEGELSPGALRRLRRGVELEDGVTAPARASAVAPHALRLTIHEGRNRQVRRMCDAVGHPVVRLVRTRIGPLADRTLAPGEWRTLSAAEIRKLQESVGNRY